jgi:hypothetical protein
MVESRIEFDWHALEEFLPCGGKDSAAELLDSLHDINKKLPTAETSTTFEKIGNSADDEALSSNIHPTHCAVSDQPIFSITFQLMCGTTSSVKLPSWMWCSALTSIVESLFGIPAHAQCHLLRGWPLVVQDDMTLEEAGLADNDVLTVVLTQPNLSGLWMCSAGPSGFKGSSFAFSTKSRDDAGEYRVMIMCAESDISAPVVQEDASCAIVGSKIVVRARSADGTGYVRCCGEVSSGHCGMISGWATAQSSAAVAGSGYEESRITSGGCPRAACRFELVRL